MTMFAGDEVSALVIDVGTTTIKAGYAGEDTPKAVFPSFVGKVKHGEETTIGGGGGEMGEREEGEKGGGGGGEWRYYCGGNRLGRRDGMEVVKPMKEGLVDDWDLMEQVWNHALIDRLGMQPREHPILLTEPSFNTKQIREKMTEFFFEKYEVPAFFIVKEAVSSCFANGRSTGLVLDVGGEITTATPVHDGYALKKGVMRTSLAGDRLSEEFLYQLQTKKQEVLPRYRVKRKVLDGKLEIQTLDFPHTHPSYERYMVHKVLNDLKESIGRVSESNFEEQANISIPSVDYELPNGLIEVGQERFSVPECLFHPKGLQNQTNIAGEEPLMGLHELVQKSASFCDVEARRDLLSNVVVCGGTSMLTGFIERLQKEIFALTSLNRLRVITPNSNVEKHFSAWLGGSILGSLGSFQQLWISKEEYGEFGKELVERKCP